MGLLTLTHRQRRAIYFWAESRFGSKAEALRKAGYKKNVIRHPRKVFEHPSVLNELAMMGYDRFGLHRAPTGEYVGGDPFNQSNPVADFDVSKIPMADIEALKSKLDALP